MMAAAVYQHLLRLLFLIIFALRQEEEEEQLGCIRFRLWRGYAQVKDLHGITVAKQQREK